ncbi:hypothetical protein [Rhodococcus jostii]|uniref:Uncharacterized protein n=1 Tax=Rhodococcus jostii TaxID=132919 RepID=A0ABU4CUA2_RHOJO|nr:hypothetical protein [Rhodococcus jostii]MDV6286823.1 hypothetical protein [Rhodococcus jostii]
MVRRYRDAGATDVVFTQTDLVGVAARASQVLGHLAAQENI